jgi:aspartyl-tRNA(Asn)/glutamyl-tRNA(Gln) amidotransferase subunit C
MLICFGCTKLISLRELVQINRIMISLEDVEHIAKLARLSLTDEEKKKYASQLSRLIDHFQQLNEIDTSSIEPVSHILPIVNVLREDKVSPSYNRDELLANAPEKENGFFKVPKITD